MRLAVAGGIFDTAPEYQRAIVTPETHLVAGLRERGVDVVAVGLRGRLPAGVDLLHLHHVGPIGVRSLAARLPVVLTRHRAPGIVAAGLRGRVAEAALLVRCQALVALTQVEADHYRRRVRSGRVRVIHNGVDGHVFSPGPRKGGREVLFVGQLLRAKGVFDLLQAFAELVRDDEALRLRLVAHLQPARAEFDAEVARLGLRAHVVVEAGMPHVELVGRYREAAVFVLPSHDEALPSVTAEAALTGTPVVSTDLPGVREQLGELASYVPAAAPPRLAQALRAALVDGPQRRDALRAARPALLEGLSLRAMVERHLDLYREVLEDAA